MVGCSPTRLLNDNQYLLQNNRIICKDLRIDKEEINRIIKQKPNRKILRLIHFHLGVYNYTSFGKERKWKKWLKTTIGEEPVALDNGLTKKSSQQIKLYLNKKGYFNSVVKDSTFYGYKRAKVFYTIQPNKPYSFGNIKYVIPDALVNSYIESDKSNSLIHKGDNYDEDVLESERIRITAYLKNNGYFDFIKEYIHYEADSALKNHTINIVLEIQNPEKDTMVSDSGHSQYQINNVIINLQNSSKSIEFKKVQGNNSPKLLDTYINLTPAPKLSLALSVDGTHNSGDFGIGGSIVYQNKNSFKGAEIFEIKLKGALEVQKLGTTSQTVDQLSIIPIKTFNTIELGPEVSLSIPKFFFPFIRPSFSKRANPKTKFVASYNFQQRPDYKRSIAAISMLYTYKETSTKQHIIYPLDINFVGVNLSTDFENTLLATNNALIIQSYKPLMITALKYSYIFSNQEVTKKRRYSYFRFNAEFAGNGVNAIVNTNHNKEKGDDGYYTLFNIRYSQYVKTDIDYRFYKKLYGKTLLVNRTTIGIGKPYGNADVLPFVKSFYAGGTNDIRAWTARSLGPGSFYGGSANYERIGDIKLQYNIEYRYNVYKMLNAATFIDAGNIWLLNKDLLRPGAEFDFSTFYKQIAVGAGFGLRYDFSFFIIRLDSALPVYDPGQLVGSEWIITHPKIKDITFNLGIGYPF